MKRILCIVRASTIRQEVESQQSELLSFAQGKGFAADEIEWLISQGASARSLNKKYIQFLEDIKGIIKSSSTIRTVAMWHINRLGRVESKLTEMKDFFVANKIQVYIKIPSVTLLQDDGTLNDGASISFSVFAATTVTETKEMMAKFRRGKDRNIEQGRYNGGKLKYGYSIDENKRFVPNDIETKKVQLIFELYSSGQYSVYRLCEELKARGIARTDKTYFTATSLFRILADECYTGSDPEKRASKTRIERRVYQRIISDELYEKCRLVRAKNYTIDKPREHFVPGSHLWMCPKCKHFLVYDAGYYKCQYYYNRYLPESSRCTHTNTYCAKHIDPLLFENALIEHIKYLLSDKQAANENLTQEKAILKDKINAAQKIIDDVKEQTTLLTDAYIFQRIYTKEQYEQRQKRLEENIKEAKNDIARFRERISTIDRILTMPTDEESLFFEQMEQGLTNMTEQEKQLLVRRYIDHGTLFNVDKNTVKIDIYLRCGIVKTYHYRNKQKNKKIYDANNKAPYASILPSFDIGNDYDVEGFTKYNNYLKLIYDTICK